MERAIVGRDRHLADLLASLDQASAGRGRMVLVCGEAGIGKSALVASAAQAGREAGVRVLVGRTTEAEGAPPYWPWLQVLDRLGERRLLTAPAGSDPDSERFHREDAVRALVAAEPTMLVVEDVHRADQATLRLIAAVAEQLADAPVLFFVTHRSEEADRTAAFEATLDGLLRLPWATRLDLAGLDRDAVRALLPGEVSGAAVDQVMQISNGNPLLVVELARHLAGGATLASVPRSVRDAVAVRLGRRSEACVGVIRSAAAVGRTFSAGVLATARDSSAMEILAVLDEAEGAGIVRRTTRSGEYEFVHALVRDGVLATMGSAELAGEHRRLAEAVEAYEPDTPARTLELARLWDAAAALGERERAARWSAAAGTVAAAQLAWEDSARLFGRALELGGASLDRLTEHDWCAGAGAALLHAGVLEEASRMCARAASAARRAGRADLAARSVVVLEGRAILAPELVAEAHAALDALHPGEHALLARLHAELANSAVYGDLSILEGHCRLAEEHAAATDDPLAEIAAVRARQMASYAPEHAAARLVLAERLGRAARLAGKPSVAIWAPLWRIDALVELGALNEAIAVLPELRDAVQAAGSPIARWHLLRTEAAVAQATGRFAEARALAVQARDLFARIEHPGSAMGIYLGFLVSVELHTGCTAELSEGWRSHRMTGAPPFVRDLATIGVVAAELGVGSVDRALARYQELPDVPGWELSPHLYLHLLTTRVHVASQLGQRDDLAALYERLLPHADRHVASGGGFVAYNGPVELWLGVAAARLGHTAVAEAHLRRALDAARRATASGFAVHATVELGELLVDGPAEGRGEGRGLLEAAAGDARRMGMAPFVERAERLLSAPDDSASATPLSNREAEVAELIAAGATNRQIAAALFISERTAQNHVQHILTKLGLANRTQIAAWTRERGGGG